MSLIIACKNKNGIVLAADRNAVDFDFKGQMVEYRIMRLSQLTHSTAILTGGTAAGEKMCESLKYFLDHEKIVDIEDVYNAALPFLASEYERFMRKTCNYLPIDPINQVHFILAGYSAKAAKNPFQLYLLWTKKKLPLLDGDEIETAYSVPRLITLEYHLNRMCKENEKLEGILQQIRNHLEKQREVNAGISGPYSYARITRSGFAQV